MSDLSGNIPAYVFYGSILSEFLRIAKCTLKFSDSVLKAKQLFLRMMYQGANQLTLLKPKKKVIPASNYMFKVNSSNTGTRCETCSKLPTKTLERRYWRRSSVFIVNFEHISHLVLEFILLTLNRYAGWDETTSYCF